MYSLMNVNNNSVLVNMYLPILLCRVGLVDIRVLDPFCLIGESDVNQ